MIYFKNVDFKTRDLSPLMIYSSWCASPAPSFMEKNIIKIMITKGQGTACTNIERNWKASPKRADLQTWEVKHPGRQSEKEGVTFPWVQYNGFKSFQNYKILILLCFMKIFTVCFPLQPLACIFFTPFFTAVYNVERLVL